MEIQSTKNVDVAIELPYNLDVHLNWWIKNDRSDLQEENKIVQLDYFYHYLTNCKDNTDEYTPFWYKDLSQADLGLMTRWIAEFLFEARRYTVPIKEAKKHKDIEKIRDIIRLSIDNLDYPTARLAFDFGNNRQKEHGFNYLYKTAIYGVRLLYPPESEEIEQEIRDIRDRIFPNIHTIKGNFLDVLVSTLEIAKNKDYSGVVPILGAGLAPGILCRANGAEVKFLKYHRRWQTQNPIWRHIDGFSQKLATGGNIAIIDDDSVSGKTIEATLSKLRRDLNPTNIDVYLYGAFGGEKELFEKHPDVRSYTHYSDIPIINPYKNLLLTHGAIQKFILKD